MNPQREAIPPYFVAVSYDGCTNWSVDHPSAWGTKQQCLEFVARHLPPKGCEFEILDMDSGRCVSYLVQPVGRRLRLLMEDLKAL